MYDFRKEIERTNLGSFAAHWNYVRVMKPDTTHFRNLDELTDSLDKLVSLRLRKAFVSR